MPTYLILEIDWHDETKAGEYRKLLGPTLEKHGGKTLVANAPHVLEGTWNPRRMVIFEFPSMDAVRAWHDSPEYAPLIKLRKEGARINNLIAVETPPKV